MAVALLSWSAAAPLAQAFYNPNTGRWLSRDPIEERGELNLNGFVKNRPAGAFDPDGRDDLECHIWLNRDTSFWKPPLEGKPCCCKPPGFVVFGPIEDDGSDATGFRMRLPSPPEARGCWKDLATRWTTCIRADGTSGIQPVCTDSTTCSFAGIRYGTYVIGVHIRYLSCVNGVWAFVYRKYAASCTHTLDWLGRDKFECN